MTATVIFIPVKVKLMILRVSIHPFFLVVNRTWDPNAQNEPQGTRFSVPASCRRDNYSPQCLPIKVFCWGGGKRKWSKKVRKWKKITFFLSILRRLKYQFSALRGSKPCSCAYSSKNMRAFLPPCHIVPLNDLWSINLWVSHGSSGYTVANALAILGNFASTPWPPFLDISVRDMVYHFDHYIISNILVSRGRVGGGRPRYLSDTEFLTYSIQCCSHPLLSPISLFFPICDNFSFLSQRRC